MSVLGVVALGVIIAALGTLVIRRVRPDGRSGILAAALVLVGFMVLPVIASRTSKFELPPLEGRQQLVAAGRTTDFRWRAVAYREEDKVCIRLHIAQGRSGSGGGGCTLRPAPLSVFLGRTGLKKPVCDVVGTVTNRSTLIRIEMVGSADVDFRPVSALEGMDVSFFSVIIPRGQVPKTVVAFDAGGREIMREQLPPAANCR